MYGVTNRVTCLPGLKIVQNILRRHWMFSARRTLPWFLSPLNLWPRDHRLRGVDTPDSIVAPSLEAQDSGSISSH